MVDGVVKARWHGLTGGGTRGWVLAGLGVMLAAFAVIVLRTAWITDDALITLRHVWHATQGHGLTFTEGVRVQGYTHPLWAVILTALVSVTGELFHTILAATAALSLTAIAILAGLAWRSSAVVGLWALAPLAALSFSQAFTDYMTSGLENPLAFALFGVWALVLMRATSREGMRQPRWALIFGLAGAIVLTRMDFVLIVAPVFIWLFATGRLSFAVILRQGWWAVTPVAIWLMFSTIYYGSPLPNTYYAKLAAGFPNGDKLLRGMEYARSTVMNDPVTLVVLIAGLAAGLTAQRQVLRPLMAGVLVYIAYVLLSGGDFMRGRFFAVPVYLATLVVIVRAGDVAPRARAVAAVLALAALPFGAAPILSPASYDKFDLVRGVADERGVYYKDFGLLAPRRNWPYPDPVALGGDAQPDPFCGRLGQNALANPAARFQDLCALTDPFLARLPAAYWAGWRVGHHERRAPVGYGDLLNTAADDLSDVQLRRLFTDVRLAATGPLFTPQRWAALWRLNVAAPVDFDPAPYRSLANPLPGEQALTVSYGEISGDAPAPGAPWNGEGAQVFTSVIVITDIPDQPIGGVEVWMDHNDIYNVFLDDAQIAQLEPQPDRGLAVHTVRLDRPRRSATVIVRAVAGDGMYSLGHVRLLPPSAARSSQD